MEELYRYRNHFAHGHATPGISKKVLIEAKVRNVLYIPKNFSILKKYFDWRKCQHMTEKEKDKNISKRNFLTVRDFLEENWVRVIKFINKGYEYFI